MHRSNPIWLFLIIFSFNSVVGLLIGLSLHRVHMLSVSRSVQVWSSSSGKPREPHNALVLPLPYYFARQ